MSDPIHTEVTATGWFDTHIISGAHPELPDPVVGTDTGAPAGAGVAAHLARYGLRGGLVGAMASWLHDPLTGNAEATALARTLADAGAQACWSAVPPTPGELTDLTVLVEQAAAADVAAFRLYPHTHGYNPVDPVWCPFFEGLARHRMPLCLNRTELGWDEIGTIADRCADLNVIISLIGYRELRVVGTMLARHPNLHIDLVNFATHQGVEWLVTSFGPDRLLFGTGLGLRDPGESVARLIWSDLDDAAVEQIGSGNAHRLFGLRIDGRTESVGNAS